MKLIERIIQGENQNQCESEPHLTLILFVILISSNKSFNLFTIRLVPN